MAQVYLDYNSTTPLDERVFEAMLPYFKSRFGNASSRTHSYGWEAEEAVKIARESVAALIGARPEEIIFTSGATESNNLALRGVAEMYARKGDHLITVATEHKAVLDTCAYLEKVGKRVTYLPVDAGGRIDLGELESAMTPETVLVSVMYGNNETGVIQEMDKISKIVHQHGSIFMSDATQAVGKIPVNVNDSGIDLMSFTGHKLYGPKGVGALFTRRRNPRVTLSPLIHGGGHERGFRSGTLNVPGIVGLGAAATLCSQDLETEQEKIKQLRDQLQAGLLDIPKSFVNGYQEDRLPNVTNMSFQFVEAEALIMAMRDLAVATGSACTSASIEPSHVLKAMGLGDDDAYASIRFSLGRFSTETEVKQAIESVKAAIEKLRAMNPDWKMQS